MNLSQKNRVRLLCMAIDDSDLQAVQELLADGCPTSHAEVRLNPLKLALQYGNTQIIDALLDAGAQVADADAKEAVSSAIKHGNIRIFNQAVERGDISAADFDGLLFDASTKGTDALALRLLELGANPVYQEKGASSFKRAVVWGRNELVAAMLERLTQEQKDELLATHVQEGFAACVKVLLDSGADAAQKINGRTLLQTAPRSADEVKRLLRSIRTGESIEMAMGGNDGQPPGSAPSKPLTL